MFHKRTLNIVLKEQLSREFTSTVPFV